MSRPILGTPLAKCTHAHYTTILVKDEEIDVEVLFKLHGRYLRATRDDPHEFPEVEIVSIRNCDTRKLMGDLPYEESVKLENELSERVAEGDFV